MGEILRDMLMKHEGLRLKPYKDTVGKLTIGYGRNLDDKGISEIEASIMLDNDIKDAKNDLFTALPWTFSLDENRQSVLINMCFNMGIVSLLKFKQTLSNIQSGDYEKAASCMLDSLWAKQVGSRATYLANVMKTGEL